MHTHEGCFFRGVAFFIVTPVKLAVNHLSAKLFQQNGKTSHTATETVTLFSRSFPDRHLSRNRAPYDFAS